MEKLTVIVAVVLFLALGVKGCVGSFNNKLVEATVTSKTVKRKGKTDKYLIFTDKETFENTDNMLRGKFNSSDFYGKIEENKKYQFVVVGWRIPIFSEYRNIINIKEVSN